MEMKTQGKTEVMNPDSETTREFRSGKYWAAASGGAVDPF